MGHLAGINGPVRRCRRLRRTARKANDRRPYSVATVTESAETAVGSPQLAGAAGSLGHQSRQFFPVGDRERDVRAATAGGRSAIGLHRKVPFPEESDVERGQQELL